MPQLIHLKTKKNLATQLLISHSFFKRIKGLLGKSHLHSKEVMWIQPCSSIHTLFMKFPIDVIFVDKHLQIQCYYENVPPWKILTAFGQILSPLFWLFHPSTYNIKNYFKTYSVFEFQAGRLAHFQIKKGDTLYVEA